MDGGLEPYFLHEHQLIYNDDQQEDWCCNACGLPLLSSPSYRCNNNCNFFLHKACRQLPQEFRYITSDGLEYCLSLVLKPHDEAWTCDVCSKLCKNSIIYRSNSTDKITVHVDALCAPFPLEIMTTHESHQHELVAIRREALLLCDICGRQHKGFFFSCKDCSCDFWIHKDCAILPRIIEINSHDHALAFSFSTFGEVFPMSWKSKYLCQLCRKMVPRTAAYYCGFCECIFHTTCVVSAKESSGHQMVQFPMSKLPIPEEADKSLFLHAMLNKKSTAQKQNDQDEKLGIEMYHNHPNLIFHDNININDKDYSSLCNACIQPINSHPFYNCEEVGCDFLLHEHCTNLPFQIDLKLLSSAQTSLARLKHFFSLFNCEFCRQKCNGVGYEFKITTPGNYFRIVGLIDLECASLPRSIKHQLHNTQHVLCLVLWPKENLPFACCSDYDSGTFIVYKCISCSFKIHTKCALLPAKVCHKFDKHPLQLSNVVNDNEHSFCEICEGNINMKLWFYHCMECDQFFHVNCIPSVGVLSKIKFGGDRAIPRRHLSDHPMTLTRMLNIGNQRCEECKQIIEGFSDRVAFQCSKCCYWIHYHCSLEEVARIWKVQPN